MAQTTANLVGSVLSSRAQNETPEAIISSSDDNNLDLDQDQNYPTMSHSSSNPMTSTTNASLSKKDWKGKAKNIHRIVEQIEQEPIGIVVFKWCLILVGSVMLGVVLFLTGEVIYAWSTGELKQQKLEVFEAINNSSMTSGGASETMDQ